MNSKKDLIRKAVGQIEHEDAGLLGFVVSENIDNYTETGLDIIRLFETYPEQAEWFDKMLIAVCGWSIESLLDRMEERRDYYEGL